MVSAGCEEISDVVSITVPEVVKENLTLEELKTELETVLSRESILHNLNPLITNLVLSSENLSVLADSLVSHPSFLGATSDDILSAASISEILKVDKETRIITPDLKSKRSTLIIREANPNVTPKDILLLLKNCPRLEVHEELLDVNSDNDSLNNVSQCCPYLNSITLKITSWFLTFINEEITADVAWWLRTQKLLDEPVQVRIKTELALRFDTVPSSVNSVLPTVNDHVKPYREWKTNIPSKHTSWKCQMCSDKVINPELQCTCPKRNKINPNRRGRGGRNRKEQRNGQRTISNKQHLAYPNQKQIVVVTSAEFPPLCEPITTKSICGYNESSFTQHTMEQVKSICQDISEIEPPLLADGITDFAVFEENGPRKHEWCFHALTKANIIKTNNRRSSINKNKDGKRVVVLSETIGNVVDGEQDDSSICWAKRFQKVKQLSDKTIDETVVLPTCTNNKVNHIKFGNVETTT